MVGASTVLVVDRDEQLRATIAEGFVRLGFDVLSAASGPDGRGACDGDVPALAVLDVESGGFELCRELHERYGSALPVVLISGERVEALDRVAGLLMGADDYLAKPLHLDELLARARRSMARAAREVDRAPPPAPGFDLLTAREQEVLGLLADGLGPRQVAAVLVVAPKTVATHIQHILTKLGVHSRLQAITLELQRRTAARPPR